MVNVVNATVDAYGKPDEIRIELARELKKSAKEREEMAEAISKSTKEFEEYKKILQKEFGLINVSRNDITRYRLYRELKGNGYKTLYSNTYIPGFFRDFLLFRVPFLLFAKEENGNLRQAKENAGDDRDDRINMRIVLRGRKLGANRVHAEAA